MLLFRRWWLWIVLAVAAVLLLVWFARRASAAPLRAPASGPPQLPPPPPPQNFGTGGGKTEAQDGDPLTGIGKSACMAKGGTEEICSEAASAAEWVRNHTPLVWGINKIRSFF